MKKLMIMAIVIMPVMAHGATMCSKNDTITIALNPAIKGNTYGSNKAYSTWWTSFSYGTIRGISACLSSNNGKTTGGTVSKLTDTNPDTNESARVIGGETNGQYCWCKMTHPALSRWAFSSGAGSASSCASDCEVICGNYVRDYSALRDGLFGSVGQ